MLIITTISISFCIILSLYLLIKAIRKKDKVFKPIVIMLIVIVLLSCIISLYFMWAPR